MEQPGFYPKGGGSIVARIHPGRLGRLELPKRGRPVALRARVVCSGMGLEAIDEARTALEAQLTLDDFEVRRFDGARGLAVLVEVEHRCLTELFCGLADRGQRVAEAATEAAVQALAWSAQPEPVGQFLADQLLLPMALGEGGAFRSVRPSLHSTTNAEVLRRFLPVEVTMEGGELRVTCD